MSRIHQKPNPRVTANLFAGVAAVIGATLIAAAPARADHAEDAFRAHFARVAVSHVALASDLIFGHAPVVRVERVVYSPRARHAHGRHGRVHAHCAHLHPRAYPQHGFRRGIPPHERWEHGPRDRH